MPYYSSTITLRGFSAVQIRTTTSKHLEPDRSGALKSIRPEVSGRNAAAIANGLGASGVNGCLSASSLLPDHPLPCSDEHAPLQHVIALVKQKRGG